MASSTLLLVVITACVTLHVVTACHPNIQQQRVSLESWNYQYNERSWSHMGAVVDMELLEEHTEEKLCVSGDTFDFFESTTWVKDGCRGDFNVATDPDKVVPSADSYTDNKFTELKEVVDDAAAKIENLELKISELTSKVDELTNKGPVANIDCYVEGEPELYQGEISVTASGITCEAWLEWGEELPSNFCRKPLDDSEEKPWCYIGALGGDYSWEYCAVPVCEGGDDDDDDDDEEGGISTLTASTSDPTDGDDVVLTCGHDPDTDDVTSYEFFKDDVSLVDSASATYSLTPLTYPDDGVFTCVAKAGALAYVESNEVDLTLIPKIPTMTIAAGLPAKVNYPAYLFCTTTSAITSQPEYTFYRNGVVIAQQGGSKHTLDMIQMSENGAVFTCTLGLKGKVSSMSKDLTMVAVENGSTLTTYPSTSDPIDGDDVVLTCGHHPPKNDITSYEFFKDGVSLVDSASDEYSLTPLTYPDDGIFTCVAKAGALAYAESNEADLTLIPKTPTMTIDPLPAKFDKAMEIICEKTSTITSQPKFSFYRNGVLFHQQGSPLKTLDKIQMSENGDVYTCTLELNGKVSSMSEGVTLVVVDV